MAGERERKHQTDAAMSKQEIISLQGKLDKTRQQLQATQRQLAAISSKNHYHSSLNPLAQYQNTFSIDEVLAAPEVAWPLTRPMCSPIGDGAAALVVCSDEFANKIGAGRPVEVAACCMASGVDQVEGQMDSSLFDLAPITELANT